ncbi:MAG TPA: hypothetical protein VED17_10845, partial [Nitrososphaerales archaeon]|nr:hypothetical protein [Nitrososphaerales archaeon]
NLANDPFDSYRIFQGRIIDEYENMAEHDDFTVIDATRDIEEQQILVRQKVTSVLPRSLAAQLVEASHVSAPMNSGASIEAGHDC